MEDDRQEKSIQRLATSHKIAVCGGKTAEEPEKVKNTFKYPHGITPPMKSARNRRFRKTKKMKFMDAPEVEKELKRLLRQDMEADSVRWEVVGAASGNANISS